MNGRKFKFPRSAERSPAAPAALCPADRVLNLYNQANSAEAQRITKKVKAWFTETAHADGWDQVGFLPEVQSQHGAGCILYKSFGSSRGDNIIKKLSND